MSAQPTDIPDNSRPEARRPEAGHLEVGGPVARRPEARRPAGVSRLGILTGFLATAGTLGVALLGLGGPPAPATPVALADTTATDPAAQQVVVKTVYVQLPSPPAAPVAVAAAPKAVPRVVTRQSGAGGDDEGEHEGEDD